MNTLKPTTNTLHSLQQRCTASLGPWLVAAALCTGAPVALAQVPLGITAGEMALLPDYCADVQATGRYTDPMGGNPSPRSPAWVQAMGATFWAMHHHCWALIRMHRSRQPGIAPHVREHHIRGAIADYIYVLDHERPGFPLKPEVYARLGEAYAALPAPGEALEAYQKARELKADYWPAYTWAADTLMTLGRRKEALALLEEGLRNMPGNPQVSRKIETINRGGNAKAPAATKPATPVRSANPMPKPAAAASSPAPSRP